MFWAMLFAAPSETLAQRFVRWWTDEERLSQRSQIETRSPHKQRNTTAAFDFFDPLCRFAGPFARRVVDVRGDEIDQMMRDALALVERYLSGGDLDFFVDLDGVAVDDLAV